MKLGHAVIYTILMGCCFSCSAGNWIAYQISHETSAAVILATVHTWPTNESAAPSISEVEPLLLHAERLYFEVDFYARDSTARRDSELRKIMNGRTLSGTFAPSIVSAIRGRISAEYENLKWEDVNSLHPWYIYISFSCPPIVEGAVLSLDVEIYKLAARMKVFVDSLETTEYQMRASVGADLDAWVTPLKKLPKDRVACRNNQEPTATLRTVVNSYVAKNPQAAYQITTGNFALPWAESSLNERNSQMHRKIVSAMSRYKSIVFAVGWSHLIGSNGLLELLRGQGYKVEECSMSEVRTAGEIKCSIMH